MKVLLSSLMIFFLYYNLYSQDPIFEIETANDINPLFWAQQSDNRLGILTSDPQSTFHIFNTAQIPNPDGILFLGNHLENYMKFDFYNIQTNQTLFLQDDGGDINLGNFTMYIDQQNGFVGINKTNIDTELDILGEMEMSTAGLGTTQKDKIAIFGSLESSSMLGFGFETGIIPQAKSMIGSEELYFKSAAGYNWYVNSNAGGTPKMVLDPQGYLGVGTDGPLSKLHISDGGGDPLIRADGGGITRFMVENNGQTGIGVLDPLVDLHIVSRPGTNIAQLLLAPDIVSNGESSEILLGEDDNFTYGMAIRYDGTENKLKIFGNNNNTQSGPHFTVERDSGKTAIGYSGDVPTGYMLAVDGEIISEGMLCELSGNWADFVFDESYMLKPLEEVESFVKQNRHLPGFPTSVQLKEEGLDFEEIITLQHQKIEELTLYLIQMKKEIDELKKKIK